MTDFEDFKVLVKGLKSAYTSPNFLPDGEAVKVWYMMLRDIEHETLKLAVYKYIMSNKFPPTVSDLRELAATITAGETPDWGTAWESVLRAIRNYGTYNETGALNSLDEITQQCVRRLGWREICMSEKIAVERANFRQIYESLVERKKDTLRIAPGLQQKIAMISDERKLLDAGD